MLLGFLRLLSTLFCLALPVVGLGRQNICLFVYFLFFILPFSNGGYTSLLRELSLPKSSGGTFIAHTQIVITNTGNNTCKIVCSVEAEFPNGPPMVGRQIKSGMRAGTADAFVIFGETICKYSDAFP